MAQKNKPIKKEIKTPKKVGKRNSNNNKKNN